MSRVFSLVTLFAVALAVPAEALAQEELFRSAGTPAAYARPFQHFHFFEPSRILLGLIEPKKREPYFHYVADARSRGALVKTIQGSPRKQLRDSGTRKFYQLMILESCTGEDAEKIPLDLFTKEGIAECFEHLAEDGVLCVHTSHRFLDLPLVLGAIGKDLKLHVRVGHNRPDESRYFELEEAGASSSQWVLLTRNEKVLETICKLPAIDKGKEEYWTRPRPFDQVWTDKGPNLLHGVLRGHPVSMRYASLMEPVIEFLNDLTERAGVNNRAVRDFIFDLGQLPGTVVGRFMRYQLANSPRVETLWP